MSIFPNLGTQFGIIVVKPVPVLDYKEGKKKYPKGILKFIIAWIDLLEPKARCYFWRISIICHLNGYWEFSNLVNGAISLSDSSI